MTDDPNRGLGRPLEALPCGLPGCRKKIQIGSRRRAYCSEACAKKARYHRHAQGQKRRRETNPLVGITAETIHRVKQTYSRGATYTRFLDNHELLADLLTGAVSHQAAAEILNMSREQVTRLVNQFQLDVGGSQERVDFTPEIRVAELLIPVGVEAEWPLLDDPQKAEELDLLVERFVQFSDMFFTDESGETPPDTPDFHRRWTRAFIQCWLDHSRQQVLAPPRHGKTSLMLRIMVWFINSRPNIRIGWISGAGDIAESWLGAIRDELTTNEKLRAAYLAPGQDYRPDLRSGKPWSNEKFTVATRTVTGIAVKSPTMVAIGAQGTVHSRDFDVLVVDDFEDYKRNLTSDQQEKNRRWFGQVATARKEDRNAIFVIGSRQAEDDLGIRLIKNPEWATIVDTAHDPECAIDEYDEPAHVACMLWPKFRPYSWLISRKRELANLGGDSLWAMMYLNRTLNRGLLAYDAMEMKLCLDSGRTVGNVPADCKLVGGLDPAPVNTQAAFLWAYHPPTRRLFVVDIAIVEAGGFQGVRAIVDDWFKKYGLRTWVIEETGWQKAIHRDELLRAYCALNGIHVMPHETQAGNKWDRRYGVAATGGIYREEIWLEDPVTGDKTISVRRVNMPYGDTESMVKIDRFIDQAASFSESQLRDAARRGKSDILMAQWFPMKVIRQWDAEILTAAPQTDYEPSFDGYAVSTLAETPW